MSGKVETFTPGGGTLLISGAFSITESIGGGVAVTSGNLLPAVADLAGNPVRETRINDETLSRLDGFVVPTVEDDALVIAADGGRLRIAKLRRGNGGKQAAAEAGLAVGDRLG